MARIYPAPYPVHYARPTNNDVEIFDLKRPRRHSRSDVPPSIDRSRGTLVACVLGLIFSVVVGCGCIVLGVYSSTNVSLELTLNLKTREAIPLGINAIIVVCTEALGYIHSTTLKWALYREKRLDFNANIRLITFANKSMPNNTFFNIIYFISLAICYAASPLIIIPKTTATDGRGSATMVISQAGPFCLGGSLLLQCLICTWCLIGSKVETWNSNPLVTAAVAMNGRMEYYRPIEGRCMASVHDKDRLPGKAYPRKPRKTQKSAQDARKHLAHVVHVLAVIQIVLIVWAILVCYKGYQDKSGRNWGFLPKRRPSDIEPSNTDEFTPSVNLLFNMSEDDQGVSGVNFLAVLMFAAVIQSTITAGMHCAELQVTLSRDEATWRTLVSTKGCRPAHTNAFWTSITSWQSVVLLISKPVVHWVYSLALTVIYDEGVFMFGPQVVYLALVWLAFIVFVYYVSVRKPEGPLPATFGHVQTMIDLLDDWSDEQMFWGDKRRSRVVDDGLGSSHGRSEEVRHAGIGTGRMPEVDMGVLYSGV